MRRERPLDALWRDCIAAAAVIVFATAIGGVVAYLHGWAM